MAHLAVPRRGWENEHLATFLLSRIAFVAHPFTVADDIGSDFFCTLFESRDRGGTELLFPLNSFAIQVKSNRDKVPATNKIEYLLGLELPFLLGVVDRPGLRLAVYSGEHLPVMFSDLGRPTRLTLCPVDQADPSGLYYKGKSGGPCSLRLPLVLELSAADDGPTLQHKRQLLAELCSRVHSNISARTSNEYIFRLNPTGEVVILAGPSSAQTFRGNFFLRLAEVFYNLEWLLLNQPTEFSRAEFELYERLYMDLLNHADVIPDLLRGGYERLRKRLSQRTTNADR